MCDTCTRSQQFTSGGERHRVFERNGQVWVDHVDIDKGKHDKVNLTQNMGVQSVEEGVRVVQAYHEGNGPSYYDGGAQQ